MTDPSRWQPLSEHLQGAARLAAGFGRPLGVEKAAGLAALLHDLGKYSAPFQARLRGAEGRVDHATAGAAEILALAEKAPFPDRIMAELLAYAIAGHHGGLPDRRALRERREHLAAAGPFPDPAWRRDLAVDPAGLARPLRPVPSRQGFQLAFLGRMLFSCMVDADYRDTEAFYDRATGAESDRSWPPLPQLIDGLLSRFDAHMALLEQRAEASPVNALRHGILEHLRSQGRRERGLFTLTVPTGGGKTLASLGFALEHARRHGLERILYAIPFTSVIDQTAAVFRAVLGEEVILEHHSAIEEEKPATCRDKWRLAMEDWAAPVVLTTNVQLFESLFAHRPSRCRKLHNLANSVIILDEAQTLPLPLLAPCVAAIDELARNYGCSVVLCTATQPALDRRYFAPGTEAGLELEGRELAPDPAGLAARLRRVTLRRAGTLDDGQLVAELAEHPQALVIVNTRKHALALYRRAWAAGLDGVLHLSTRQYAAHRRAALAEIRGRLADGQPCRVISTSLIEAGVDVDFPRVWRAEAGLDQIAQAAGRCNREGKRPAEDSIVTIFTPADDPPPRDIARMTEAYARMAARHTDPLSPDALRDYFTEAYWQQGAALDRDNILSLFKVDPGGLSCDYRTAAELFRMIDGGMAPVIVARDAEARQALAQLDRDGAKPGPVARRLQPFTVQVPPPARIRLFTAGHLAFAREDRFGDQFAVLRTDSLYHQDIGLLWEDADYLGLEQTFL